MSLETSRRDFLQKIAFTAGLGGVIIEAPEAKASSDGLYPAGAPGPGLRFHQGQWRFPGG